MAQRRRRSLNRFGKLLRMFAAAMESNSADESDKQPAPSLGFHPRLPAGLVQTTLLRRGCLHDQATYALRQMDSVAPGRRCMGAQRVTETPRPMSPFCIVPRRATAKLASALVVITLGSTAPFAGFLEHLAIRSDRKRDSQAGTDAIQKAGGGGGRLECRVHCRTSCGDALSRAVDDYGHRYRMGRP